MYMNYTNIFVRYTKQNKNIKICFKQPINK